MIKKNLQSSLFIKHKTVLFIQAWQHTFVIPALGKLRQTAHKTETISERKIIKHMFHSSNSPSSKSRYSVSVNNAYNVHEHI